MTREEAVLVLQQAIEDWPNADHEAAKEALAALGIPTEDSEVE